MSMDFNNFCRGFFGFNRMNPEKFGDPFSEGHFKQWNDEDQDDHRDEMDSFFDESIPSLFQHMEDMFNNMFSIHSGFLDFPKLEMQEEQKSPRDIMLREPDRGRCEKGMCPEPKNQLVDSDLDDRVAQGGLSALGESNVLPRKVPEVRSYRKSISSKFIRSADGTIEEHRTVTDSDGKTVTTVKKSIGDQTYQVTTERDSNGIIEEKRDFINVDENDIPEFEKRFSKSRSFHHLLVQPKSDEVVPQAPPGDSRYVSIFKRLFG